jgi:hypothetical protein
MQLLIQLLVQSYLVRLLLYLCPIRVQCSVQIRVNIHWEL